MSQCCCGRYKDLYRRFTINNVVHEPYGPPENFCGSVLEHILVDTEKELEICKEDKRRLVKRVEQFEAVLNEIALLVGLELGYAGVDSDDQTLIEEVKRKGKCTWLPIEVAPLDRPILIREKEGWLPDLVRWRGKVPEKIVDGCFYLSVPAGWFRLYGGRSHILEPKEWLNFSL